ncbi:DUF1846 domain-containing protein, partial [Patescibacteria group bacterium]|nr:DUF1846 domain-containing protein [Patescibacteria group bacterium]
FGGKLLDDFHASRVLPGYDANAKLTLLKSLKKDLGIIFCVSAKQLTERKILGNWGVSYDEATIKALKVLRENRLSLLGVVINRFDGEMEVEKFEKRLRRMGVKVYKRREIEDYPNNLKKILSGEGYGGDDYVEGNKPLVVVWGVGPGSGKLSTCLGQVYLDTKRGIDSGYAKFETFPVWNLNLKHPVNEAYEASTADLGDFNLIDKYHKQSCGEKVVNYNRDVEAFPIIKEVFDRVLDKKNFSRQYKSPTDMGVNCIKNGIIDDGIVCEGAKKGIILYWFRYLEEYKNGLVDRVVLDRMKKIMDRVGITENYLKTVVEARKARKEAKKSRNKGEKGIFCGASIELGDGRVIMGKNSKLLHAEAAVVLNAVKEIGKIPDDFDLIFKSVIMQINKFKKELGDRSFSLDCFEALLALAISARDNPLAKKALRLLVRLKTCYMHTTHKPSVSDEKLFRKLGMWLTTDGMIEKIR